MSKHKRSSEFLDALDGISHTYPPEGNDWSPCVDSLIEQLSDIGFDVDVESQITTFALWLSRKLERHGAGAPGGWTEDHWRMVIQTTGEIKNPTICVDCAKALKTMRDVGVFGPVEHEAAKGRKWSEQGKKHLTGMNKEKQDKAEIDYIRIRKEFKSLEPQRKSGDLNISECYDIITEKIRGPHGEKMSTSKINRALGKMK